MWIDPLSSRLLKGAGSIGVSEGRGPVVFMYHSIGPAFGKSADEWTVSARNFRQQLTLLKKEGWNTVCVRDLIEIENLLPRTAVLTFDDGYADNFDYGFEVLLEYRMRATWFVVTQDIGRRSSWLNPKNTPKPMLSIEQLRQMAEAGMEIASHTRTHPHLPELDPQSLWQEVSDSKKELEDSVGDSVISFAYPYGKFNENCVAAVRNAGYRVACTARPGWLGSENDLLRVRRVSIFAHDNLSTFARKLAFADNNVDWKRMRQYAVARMKARLLRKGE